MSKPRRTEPRTRQCYNHTDAHPHAPATFGVYCHRCLAALKREAAERRRSEQYWRAVEAGAGDLWRVSH